MRLKIKSFLFLCACILGCNLHIDAQYITVKDTAFAKTICSQYPSIMNYNCKNLDTTSAGTITNTLNLINNEIDQIKEISYFNNASVINASYNNIKSIPPILKPSKWTKMLLGHNQLNELSDLSMLKTTLKEIDLSFNQLVSIPQLENMINLEFLNLSNNKLRNLPNMRLYKNIEKINLSNNYLSFKDFIQFTTLPNPEDFRNYIFGNQYNLTNDTTITSHANYPIELRVPIDEGIPGITYTWHKGTAIYTTTTVNTLTMPFAQKSDSGSYWVSVTSNNAKLKTITVRSGNIHVKVLECQEILQFNFSTKSSCDQTTASLDNIELPNMTAPFSLFIQNALTNELINIQKYQTIDVQNGNYHLIADNNNGCVIKKENALIIRKSIKCPINFSPNGDGIQDEVYLNGNEEISILNKEGQIIRKIQLPTYWNGTDNNGNDAPTGSYALIRKDGSSEKINLLR